MRRAATPSILLILLLGAVLRIGELRTAARFGPDEALYATFGRRVALHGDWLFSGAALDKPPLYFYALGGSFVLFGMSEFAARLPNLAASLLTISVLYALAARLYDRRVAWLAALLLACSPFDRAFAVSAFTDPLLTLFILAACLAAISKRWACAGLLLVGAFGVKPSALQWIPLVVLLGATLNPPGLGRKLRNGLIAFGFGVVLLAGWSAARMTAPDFWTLNAYNNNPGRFIRANELLPRFQRWINLLGAALPFPVVGWLAVAFVHSPPRTRLVDIILTGYTLISLAVLWLVAFNTYDRYLHTLIPLLILLAARVWQALSEHVFRSRVWVGGLLIGALVLLPNGPYFGTDPAQSEGIDQIAAMLNHLPAGTVVYDHSLGWQLGFYLGDSPAVQIIWEPDLDALVAAARKQPGYFVSPQAEETAWYDALDNAGIPYHLIERDGAFEISRVGVEPLPR